MNKSSRPETYLKKASELLLECEALGIWAKVNILLYAGETQDTIDETREWLSKHRRAIKGVSVNPLFIYRYNTSSEEYMLSLERYGAQPVVVDELEELGFARMHLSKEIDYGASVEIAKSIRQEFMTQRDYYDLKAFSYFPRWFRYEHFLDLIKKSNPNELPFSITLPQQA